MRDPSAVLLAVAVLAGFFAFAVLKRGSETQQAATILFAIFAAGGLGGLISGSPRPRSG